MADQCGRNAEYQSYDANANANGGNAGLHTTLNDSEEAVLKVQSSRRMQGEDNIHRNNLDCEIIANAG